ncbi:hypothetical protein TTHERM_00635710 (macronuclear) [Tetrahymena thermophila SB210]|uniref:Immobilization antigen n=1 Tax=Tetrahymena thermophila (strain SB210) TaxID=312017 RepID=Q22WY0_TETTS|nr:hypothetical protein TTHERM_00635710 [Tetrahymena thermophila SB210]EAR89866.1 hypothetical protein TTHERM_00635710 [Tetrahymena thermophila SB210]|eukprot:XP_001010111.1 hypothetical protein TTHERM_00635710 [Tetrahymena thermophila SB210]
MKKFANLIIISCFILAVTSQPPIVGNSLECNFNAQSCDKCAQGSAAILKLFDYVNGFCRVKDCSQLTIGNNLNGWVCNSCSSVSQVPGIISQGQYFDGTKCVNQCSQGYFANKENGFVCQLANPGQPVDCSFDKTGCKACYFFINQNNQFSFDKNSQMCFVNDCSSNVNSKLNGWICQSCKSAKGSGNIPKGQYYDGQTCVDTCPQGLSASLDTQFICQPPPNPGKAVGCSKDQSTCQECEFDSSVFKQFAYQSANNCYVKDCHVTALLGLSSGWICNSCSQAQGKGNIPKGQYFDNRNCVTNCPIGKSASAQTGFECLANPQPTPCSQDFSTCTGCGDTAATQQLFTYINGNNCAVNDCSITTIGSNLNGWICNSCSTTEIPNTITKGRYYYNKSCVDTCPSGYQASAATGYNCQKINPGSDVSCSSGNQACGNCGSTRAQQLFISSNKGQSCKVKDCSSTTIGSNLNGWICQSCLSASGTGNIASGQYFDGRSCVNTCPIGSTVSKDTGYVCQFPPSSGNPVPCSSDSQTCGGCGTTDDIQGLFSRGTGNTCQVTDCNLSVVGSNLNGWVCNSCSQTNSDHNIAKGQYYNGTTCVDTCPKGQQASAATGFVCQYPPNPGSSVTCSSDSSTCNGCGQSKNISSLFTYKTGNNCSVSDCNSTVIGSNLNGWICNSCSSASGANNIVKGKYYNGITCVDSCPAGQQANAATGFICKNIPNPGTPVACSTDSSTCNGCFSNLGSSIFTYGTGNNCYVTDCTASTLREYNGWVCNSCNSASGDGNIAAGQYFNGRYCVSSCPSGQYANLSTQYVCQPIVGNPGTPVTCSSDSSTCGGCGQTNAIQNLFTFGVGNSCFVVDCTASTVGSNLNGWVCNSCSSATGNGNITVGQYYNGTTCVASCPPGQQASLSTGWVCQPIPNPGSNVTCSNDSQTCAGCGLTNDIQKLFTHGTQNQCSVTDCSSAVVGSNLNGWVCNSCSTAKGQNNIATGQYYNGTTCVASCPNGQSASASTGYVCKPGSSPAPVNNNASQSSIISYILAFVMLKLLI